MDTSKQELRARFKALRAAIPAEERGRIDDAITRQVVQLPAYRTANWVLAYLSFGAEVETRGIIQAAWADGKHVALPRCVPGTRTMTWHEVTSFNGLVHSALGVEEPADDPATAVDPYETCDSLVLVPGLTFDEQGFRLGYGGGFYDVFLARFDGCTMGLCRDAQFCERVEALDEHDLPVQFVVTESRVLNTGAAER